MQTQVDLVNRLLIRIQKGKLSALEELIEVMNGKMTYFAKLYLFDKSLRGDLVNETFIKLMRYIPTFKDSYNGINWILKILHHEAIRMNKEYNSYYFCELGDDDFSYDNTDLLDNQYIIKNVVSELNEDLLQIYEYYFVYEYNIRDIAKKLNSSKSTIARKIEIIKNFVKKRI